MKTIASLKGAAFLRACNAVRFDVDNLLKNTKVLDIRKKMPVFTGEETAEEKKKRVEEKAKENINEMLNVLLDEYAEETYAVIEKMCVLEDGEDPDGLDIAIAAMEIISNPKVLDFLLSLAKLEL